MTSGDKVDDISSAATVSVQKSTRVRVTVERRTNTSGPHIYRPTAAANLLSQIGPHHAYPLIATIENVKTRGGHFRYVIMAKHTIGQQLVGIVKLIRSQNLEKSRSPDFF